MGDSWPSDGEEETGESWPSDVGPWFAWLGRLVPEAGEAGALCGVCDGAPDGCSACVGGIRPDIIDRVHAQGQRDMLAKTVRQLRRDSDAMKRYASECMDSGRFVAEMAAKRLREQAVDLLAAVKP